MYFKELHFICIPPTAFHMKNKAFFKFTLQYYLSEIESE